MHLLSVVTLEVSDKNCSNKLIRMKTLNVNFNILTGMYPAALPDYMVQIIL